MAKLTFEIFHISNLERSRFPKKNLRAIAELFTRYEKGPAWPKCLACGQGVPLPLPATVLSHEDEDNDRLHTVVCAPLCPSCWDDQAGLAEKLRRAMDKMTGAREEGEVQELDEATWNRGARP